MDAVKFEGCDCTAHAPDCFDLPLLQAVDRCGKCHGKEMQPICEECEGTGVARPRLITNWKFTQEEGDYMVEHPEARGIFLSVCSAQTPPVLVTVGNPVELWPNEVIPLKQLMKEING